MNEIIIVGSNGQDGNFLCDILSEKKHSLIKLDINYVDSINSDWDKTVDISSLYEVSNLINKLQPSQIYYLAAHHHSSEDELGELNDLLMKSYNINVLYYLNFLESIRKYSPNTKIFYAASSHIFGEPKETLQDESTIFNPKSIYAITKLDGLLLSKFYRHNYSLFASVGILYSHESPLRKNSFVSKKIVKTAVAIKNGLSDELIIGDLNAQLDWGYAGDYAGAMYKILTHNKPDDFIIASGEKIKLIDFINYVFSYLNLDWKNFVKESPELLSRKSTNMLCGNPQKLMKETGWTPKIKLKELAKLMVDYELSLQTK